MRTLSKIILIALVALGSQAKAQNFFPEQNDYAFRINADYEVPGANLKDYKAGVMYSVSFLKFLNKFTVGAAAGYRSFSAKTPSITQLDQSSGNIMEYTISPFNSVALYATGAYNIEMTEQLRLYAGINLGGYISSYSTSYRDNNTNTHLANNEFEIYFAPKVGMAIAISSNVDLDLRSSYNVFTPGFSYDTRTGSTGIIYTSLSVGAGLAFKF